MIDTTLAATGDELKRGLMRKRITLVLMILIALCASVLPVSSARALTLTTGIINADDVAMRKTASAGGGWTKAPW